jgi:hypothetical protein
MYAQSMSTWALKPHKPWLQQMPFTLLEPERECTYCHESWPLDGEFWNQDAKNPKGFATQCKACRSEKKAKLAEAERLRKKTAPVQADSVPLIEKPCSSCKVVKPLSKDYFKIDPSRILGFSSQCKLCRRAREKERIAYKRLHGIPGR